MTFLNIFYAIFSELYESLLPAFIFFWSFWWKHHQITNSMQMSSRGVHDQNFGCIRYRPVQLSDVEFRWFPFYYVLVRRPEYYLCYERCIQSAFYIFHQADTETDDGQIQLSLSKQHIQRFAYSKLDVLYLLPMSVHTRHHDMIASLRRFIIKPISSPQNHSSCCTIYIVISRELLMNSPNK